MMMRMMMMMMMMRRGYGLYLRQFYGSGTGQIWLDDLQCFGTEMSFVNCTHRGWGIHNCYHHEDVSILCDDGTLYEFIDILRSVLLADHYCQIQNWRFLTCKDQSSY